MGIGDVGAFAAVCILVAVDSWPYCLLFIAGLRPRPWAGLLFYALCVAVTALVGMGQIPYRARIIE